MARSASMPALIQNMFPNKPLVNLTFIKNKIIIARSAPAIINISTISISSSDTKAPLPYNSDFQLPLHTNHSLFQLL